MPKTDSVLAALGQNVRQTREIKQLTQEKLAEFASLDPTYISGIESGCETQESRTSLRLRRHSELHLHNLQERS
jgi:hypothetical protein